jgi:Uma2 family endonuclease
MATASSSANKGRGGAARDSVIEYPESDGKPLGETGIHFRILYEVMGALWHHFEADDRIAILANMFVYYVEGNPRKVVCPDIFVTRDVPSNRHRRTFKVWNEGKAPDLMIELTSKSTRNEDLRTKFRLYQDTLKAREYVLFDPEEDYLKPSLQGFRLIDGRYEPIARESGRLPSEVLGLHFERDGLDLRLYDPRAGRWLPRWQEVDESLKEEEAARRREEAARREAESARRREEAARREAESARMKVEAENERLRREIEEMRKRLPGDG